MVDAFLLAPDELPSGLAVFEWFDVAGQRQCLSLDAGLLADAVGQVAVVGRAAGLVKPGLLNYRPHPA